jgi:hypothetical protein
MAELLPSNIAGNMLAGYQGAQQIQSNRQANELRQLQMQQAQGQMQRDEQFRNQLGTYLQGGSNALAEMYATDPERAMQVQQFQVQQNQLARQRDVETAKKSYAEAQGILLSEAPATYFRVLMPDKAEMFAKQRGKSVDEITDEEATSIANQVATLAGAQAGLTPEFTEPKEGQQNGQDVFFRTEKRTGRTEIVPGVSPRPQRPLVQVDTGNKANLKGQEKLAELEATSFSKLQEVGQASQDQNSSLRAMLSNPAITGATQDFKASANSFFSDLGVPISPDKLAQVSNLAQYKAIQQSVVLSEQLKQTGPQTESDRKTIQETFGNTKNIREANELVLKYKMAINDRNTLLAEIAEDYRLRKDGNIDGWRKEIRDYVRRTPLAAMNKSSGRLVFWNEFSEAMREDNPGMSEDEIMSQWRQRYATGK